METARRSAVDDRLELAGVAAVVAGVEGVVPVKAEAVDDEDGVEVRFGVGAEGGVPGSTMVGSPREGLRREAGDEGEWRGQVAGLGVFSNGIGVKRRVCSE